VIVPGDRDAAVAAAGNALTGGNYMFLSERPEAASLLDYMGSWPWYLLGAALLALAMFGLLDIPFRRRRAAWQSGTGAGGAGTVLPDG
jgi:uncharacterized membrane protein YwaF